MQVQIQKWGNSLAFRIPKAFVQEVNLSQGAVVDMSIRGKQIIVKPALSAKFSLKKLMAGVRKSNIHQEEDFGDRKGLEIW